MTRTEWSAAGVFLAACLAGLCFVRLGGPWNQPAGGDGPYYSGLARSLAEGKGYVLERSPWPTAPHLGRLPVWPFLLSLPMRLFPQAGEFAILRITTVFFHAVASVLLLYLTLHAWGSLRAGMLAGGMLALYPPAYGLFRDGYPEPCWLALTLGAILLLRRRGPAQWAGALLAGLAVLVRSNFLLLPFAIAAAAWICRPHRWPGAPRKWILLVLFLFPPGLWMLRNYAVSGAFPILSALEGETFYGGNNALTSAEGRHWGYWVFPDLIPGEKPKRELAKSMTEAEQNRYYRQKGLSYLRDNWTAAPKMVTGKLVRGFLPAPFVPRLTSYLGSLFRLLLFGAFAAALLRCGAPPRWYGAVLIAVFLVVLVTTLLFYGSARFTYCLEPFLIPPVAACLLGRSTSPLTGCLRGLFHQPRNSA